MTECPHCHATLPQPHERFCPSCGADLGVAGGAEPYTPPSALPPPIPGVPPPYTPPGYASGGGLPPPPGYGGPPGGSTPWERRDQLGLLSALVETTKQVLTEPSGFFRGMPVTGGLGAPMLYAIIIAYVGWAAASIYNVVFSSVLQSSLTQMGGGSDLARLAPFLEGGSGLIVNLLFGPVFIVIALFVSSGILHLVLLLLGGGARGFEATFRVASYGQAASIFSIVPVCGSLISLVYTLVLLVIGLSEAHQITRGKAAAAVLVPFLVICCCCVGAAFLIAFGLASAFGQR